MKTATSEKWNTHTLYHLVKGIPTGKLPRNNSLSSFNRPIPGFYKLNFESVMRKKPRTSNARHCVFVCSPEAS